jgi:hypothetical protein
MPNEVDISGRDRDTRGVSHDHHRRPRVPHPAGATHFADWYDMQFGIDHVRRYFSGSSRVVERDDNDHDISGQIDRTHGPEDGDVTRHIMVIDGNTEALE